MPRRVHVGEEPPIIALGGDNLVIEAIKSPTHEPHFILAQAFGHTIDKSIRSLSVQFNSYLMGIGCMNGRSIVFAHRLHQPIIWVSDIERKFLDLVLGQLFSKGLIQSKIRFPRANPVKQRRY